MFLSPEIDIKLCQINTKIHRFLCDIFVCRVKAYILNMICSNLPFLCKIVYVYEFSKIFDTVFFYQFLKTGTSDITIMGRDQELKRLVFSLHPFHFSITVPVNFSLSLSHHPSLSNITINFLKWKILRKKRHHQKIRWKSDIK